MAKKGESGSTIYVVAGFTQHRAVTEMLKTGDYNENRPVFFNLWSEHHE
jgi:hypothetical protein